MTQPMEHNPLAGGRRRMRKRMPIEGEAKLPATHRSRNTPGRFIQRLWRFFSKPLGPNEHPIQGTSISEERVARLIQLLSKRSDRGSGAGKQRLLNLLTQQSPSVEMVAGVNLQNLQRFLRRIENRAKKMGRGKESSWQDQGAKEKGHRRQPPLPASDPPHIRHLGRLPEEDPQVGQSHPSWVDNFTVKESD